MNTRRIITTTCAIAALALALAAGPALAQTGLIPKALLPGGGDSKTEPAPKAGATAADEVRATIATSLAAAEAALAAMENAPDPAAGVPPGTPATEIAERLTLTRQLVGIYQQQRDVVERTDAARRARLDTEKLSENWRGFATPPPYSILVVDTLRDTESNAEARIAGATARRTLLERFGTEIGTRAKTDETAARLAAEAADRGRGTPLAPTLEWRRTLTALRVQIADATQQLLQLGLRNAREDIAAGEAARDFARRQLAAAGQDAVLLPEDPARIAAEIDARQRATSAMLDKAVRVASAAREARAAADAEVARLRSTPGPTTPDAMAARAAAEAELSMTARERREASTSATMRVDLLKGHLIALDGERAVWNARTDALKSHDRVRARAAYEQVTSTLATMRAWREYLNQQLTSTRELVAEQDTRLRTATDDAELASARRLQESFRQRESDLQRALEQGQPLERLLSHFRDDFEGKRDVSYVERARDAAAAVLLWGRRVWNFEIFTVDDTLQTGDGRTIAVERSVTVGKTAGALLIVVFGYWLCSAIARRVERLVVKHAHVAPQTAALMRNWILFVLAAILIIFALVGASIPLTAFAFLGGALAIAAGFGLQTVLKNFVAGLMLLFERPMRLGDLVDVDGFRGRVTAIGIRASTITSADGIETLVPNSAFIENKLTNWTYSSPYARHTVKIGVAYGTPLRKAADAMADVLARHGQVLKDPAPQVYLDEYAESAINFALTYWVMMTVDGDSRRVKSDLLHMIDRAFGEAGIRMPFPQRDVHLDASVPLRVEVVAAPNPAGDAP